jgi:hypothetical protein
MDFSTKTIPGSAVAAKTQQTAGSRGFSPTEMFVKNAATGNALLASNGAADLHSRKFGDMLKSVYDTNKLQWGRRLS